MKNFLESYFGRKFLKAALTTVLIIAAIFVFCSCAGDRNFKYINDYKISHNDKIILPLDAAWSPTMSIIPGLPVEFNYSNADTVFEITAQDGDLVLSNGGIIEILGQSCEIKNAKNIYWRNSDGNSKTDVYAECTYLSVIVYENGNIIGFAVINIYPYSESSMVEGSFGAKILESVSFEKINGAYQKIDKNAVLSKIERIIGN